MPELPEVQTTVDGINQTVKGKTITDVWTDIAVENPKLPHHKVSTKSKAFFNLFKKEIVGAKIMRAERRAKNIFIHLNNGKSIWIHMKMTGHMMYGKYALDKNKNVWLPDKREKNIALRDPFNRFIHTVFAISTGKHLVLSDTRKFAKVTMLDTKDFAKVIAEQKFGPEPLEKAFTVGILRQQISKRPERPIKEVLLDQSIVAGIGNIYSDELLWLAGIDPRRKVKSLKDVEIKNMHSAMLKVLKKGIDFGGDSMSDYRNIHGEKGKFQQKHEAYRRKGEKCRRRGCNGIINRIVVAGRGTHFCPKHQK
jgi:formamidopyrimidine-DNA glycosylase